MSSVADQPAAREFKKLLDQAIELKDREQYGEAAQILEGLRDRYPKSASVHGILGDVYWEQGNLAEAIHSFQKAVDLSPESELASLGLFHTLWESKKTQYAVAEMLRFLSHKQSDEYAAIAHDLVQKEINKDSEERKRFRHEKIKQFFATQFQLTPELLETGSNDAMLYMWLVNDSQDPPDVGEARRLLSRVKNQLRKQIGNETLSDVPKPFRGGFGSMSQEPLASDYSAVMGHIDRILFQVKITANVDRVELTEALKAFRQQLNALKFHGTVEQGRKDGDK